VINDRLFLTRSTGRVKRPPSLHIRISNNLKYGFVYQRAPYITLKTIADNMEIDVIIEKYEEKIKILLNEFNKNSSKKTCQSIVKCDWNRN
jgi:hypothetical protein